MKYRTRIYYTEEQKAVMWERWQKGDSLDSIQKLEDINVRVVQPGAPKAKGDADLNSDDADDLTSSADDAISCINL